VVVDSNDCSLAILGWLNCGHNGGRGPRQATSATGVGVLVHGATALLVLFFLFKALES
jgi:hypothetical protein